MTTKANVEMDFDINSEIKVKLAKERKLNENSVNKERAMGKMIEERHELEKALARKKMTFKDLINWLNKR